MKVWRRLTLEEEMLLRLGRSVDLKGNERNVAVIDLLSFDIEKELVAPSLGGAQGRWPRVEERIGRGIEKANGVQRRKRKPTHYKSPASTSTRDYRLIARRDRSTPMRRELPSEQRKQRMSERVAVDDSWVSTVSQRSCPRTNGDRNYCLTVGGSSLLPRRQSLGADLQDGLSGVGVPDETSLMLKSMP
ncbi:hypothetical protein B296_00030933 [Ensete ventricosum]|uniref:Uncharacterized protein n=1 Tax=Ensete ventricosum TaxID=4639 RepID=A0A426YWC4_ENSVE|nr:hypothetical protein B296_00030933 [Ensete ventricosum]